jgi:hypothetical protein
LFGSKLIYVMLAAKRPLFFHSNPMGGLRAGEAALHPYRCGDLKRL